MGMKWKYIDRVGQKSELGGKGDNKMAKVRQVSSQPLCRDPDTHGI